MRSTEDYLSQADVNEPVVFFQTKEIYRESSGNQEDKDNENPINELPIKIREDLGNQAYLLLEYPVVYIYYWECVDNGKECHRIYIGEANDFLRRTKEHWAAANSDGDSWKDVWQKHMVSDEDEDGNKVIPTLSVLGHKCFQKSLTLDIENELIHFCQAHQNLEMLNGRSNLQGRYCGAGDFKGIFSRIWQKLVDKNKDIFKNEWEVTKSALYKASPNHKLTYEQQEAKQQIIEKVLKAVKNNEKSFIMVEGEAGTGKTVLTSSTFFGFLDQEEFKGKVSDVRMLVNHDEQLKVYKTLARTLKIKEDVVQKPTSFINEVDPSHPADVVFVDESHLLWTQKKQSYNKEGGKQLNDIMDRAKVTVIMFDEHQVLRKEQYLETEFLNEKRKLAKDSKNLITLENQLRITCSEETMEWINKITLEHTLPHLELDGKGRDKKGYEVKIFDSPEDLHAAIKEKAANNETSLSRLIATYDWPYVHKKDNPNNDSGMWMVEIGDSWKLPWNHELSIKGKQNLSRSERMKLKDLDWAEQKQTEDEVGSTFTIQGFDLAYAGVIIGPSVRYKDEKIWFDESKKAYDKMTGARTIANGEKVNVFEKVAQNELRVLMTRATSGLYIYAVDDDLRKALKDAVVNGGLLS